MITIIRIILNSCENKDRIDNNKYNVKFNSNDQRNKSNNNNNNNINNNNNSSSSNNNNDNNDSDNKI